MVMRKSQISTHVTTKDTKSKSRIYLSFLRDLRALRGEIVKTIGKDISTSDKIKT